jgi:hypothetical protein
MAANEHSTAQVLLSHVRAYGGVDRTCCVDLLLLERTAPAASFLLYRHAVAVVKAAVEYC